MSQHPSLRSSEKDKQHRSVLKRYERIKILKGKEKWDEKDSVFGLSKVKVIKFKMKKEKAAAVETAEGVEAIAPGAVATPAAGQPKAGAQAKAAPQAKGAAAAKPAAGKDAAKGSGEGKK